jgi:BolA protein
MLDIQTQIENCLGELNPHYVMVINESHLHRGHRHGGVDSHFAVVIVSEHFEGLSLVKRHRLIYSMLDSFMKSSVHALKISAYTPQEWGKET